MTHDPFIDYITRNERLQFDQDDPGIFTQISFVLVFFIAWIFFTIFFIGTF